MEIFTLYILMVVCVAAIASCRRRSALGWFVLALILSPLIALIILILIPARPARILPGATL